MVFLCILRGDPYSMRYVAFPSKLWACGLLAIVAAFGALIAMFWQRLPTMMLVVFVALLGLALAAVISQLVTSKPRLQVDEEGIRCYQPFYGTIAWEDVVAAERVPLVEKQTVGTQVQYMRSFCDAWRPIDLSVRGLEKYSKILPEGVHRLLMPERDPEVFRLRLEMSGIAGSSADAMEAIQFYLAKAGTRS